MPIWAQKISLNLSHWTPYRHKIPGHGISKAFHGMKVADDVLPGKERFHKESNGLTSDDM